ncbi:hypothetical protein FQA39_LY11078 [Lamprigera yunnana]|nr:hypothetical protein FQA39_LY11078 [Lamprigera yunnana]
MSSYSYNDFLASSNNSINDNKINAKKSRSTSHQIKKLLRPILDLLRNHKRSTYKKTVYPEDCDSEIDQNIANELLESRIFEEVDSCDDFSAVPVYTEGRMDLLRVFRGQRYIPVHFARTEAGTFFWSSIVGADGDICTVGDKNRITEHQMPELQIKEITCRGMKPLSTNQDAHRMQLRALLKREKLSKPIAIIQPFDWDKNISEITQSIKDLEFSLTEKDIRSAHIQSRLMHLDNRLTLLNPSAENAYQTSFKEDLYGQFLVLERNNGITGIIFGSIKCPLENHFYVFRFTLSH